MDINKTNSSNGSHSIDSSRQWIICGGKIPKEEIVYFSQVIIITIVIVFSLVQISLTNNNDFYKNMLCLSVGTIIPTPTMGKKIKFKHYKKIVFI